VSSTACQPMQGSATHNRCKYVPLPSSLTHSIHSPILLQDEQRSCTILNKFIKISYYYCQDVEEKVQKTFPTPIDKVRPPVRLMMGKIFPMINLFTALFPTNNKFSGRLPMLGKRLTNQSEGNVSFRSRKCITCFKKYEPASSTNQQLPQ
jgi:hypothetical protein